MTQHAKLQERRETRRQGRLQDQTARVRNLNKAYEHNGEPEHGKSEPQVKRENSLPAQLAGQKQPITISE